MRVTINSREPTAEIRFLMNPFRPSIIAATAITEVTPITIPNTVSADRALRERSVSSATVRFSKRSRSRSNLLRPQRDYRIQARRPDRGINSEEHTDQRAEQHAQQRDPGLHRSRKRSECAQRQRAAE